MRLSLPRPPPIARSRRRHRPSPGGAAPAIATRRDGDVALDGVVGAVGNRFRVLRALARGRSATLLEGYDSLRSAFPDEAGGCLSPSATPARVVLKVFHATPLGRAAAAAELASLRALGAAYQPGCGARIARLVAAHEAGRHVVLILPRLFASPLSPPSPSPAAALARLRKLAAQAAGAVACAHALGVAHGDVCARHLLLDRPSAGAGLRLIDWSGVAATHGCGVPPEALAAARDAPAGSAPQPRPPTPEGDCWALGMMIAELALRSPPFECTSGGGCDGGGGGSASLSQDAAACQLASAAAAMGVCLDHSAAHACAIAGGEEGGEGGGEVCGSGRGGMLPQPSPLLAALCRVHPSLGHLVARLCALAPGKRLTAAQAARHPFISALSPAPPPPPPHPHPLAAGAAARCDAAGPSGEAKAGAGGGGGSGAGGSGVPAFSQPPTPVHPHPSPSTAAAAATHRAVCADVATQTAAPPPRRQPRARAPQPPPPRAARAAAAPARRSRQKSGRGGGCARGGRCGCCCSCDG